MKSIKPGRGPSAMGAFGGVVVAIFGVFWIIFAVSIGAPSIFPIFGVLFIIMAIGSTVYNYKNATGSNRMSVYDITEDNEEPDPLQTRFHENENTEASNNSISTNDTETINYCPFCRYELNNKYNFCPKCGNDLSNV